MIGAAVSSGCARVAHTMKVFRDGREKKNSSNLSACTPTIIKIRKTKSLDGESGFVLALKKTPGEGKNLIFFERKERKKTLFFDQREIKKIFIAERARF